ncbi:hypothetical protein VTJ49DRAFT_3165 [Mycothermus thermophilus]|uniref:SUN domain-containing protein n=1 Tax=Humicola insolens TaxID=85995 RepID=A0ABR3V9B4_HUMIN
MDSSQSTLVSGSFEAGSQDSSQGTIAMPPRRRVRTPASPGPASPRGATPARDRAAISKTPIPAKYSTSYGSPMTQLPDRSTITGGGNVTKAAAEIFTRVKRDNIAAETRRRQREEERAARAGSPLSQVAQPPAEVPKPPTTLGTGGRAATVQSENPDEDGSQKRRSPRKRSRDKDAEDLAQKEQQERDKKLKQERAAEKRRQERAAAAELRKEQKRLEAERLERERLETERLEQEKRERERLEEERREQERLEQELREKKKAQQLFEQEQFAIALAEQEFREKKEAQQRFEQELAQQRLEQEQLARALAEQEALRQAAAAAAMPPPPHHRSAEFAHLTPLPVNFTDDAVRPGSVRSFIEEQALFNDAEVQTPVPSRPKEAPESLVPPPPPPRRLEPVPSEQPQPAPAPPSSPPSVLKKPPKRLGGTPASRAPASSSPEVDRDAAKSSSRFAPPETTSPSENRTVSNYAAGLRNRMNPLPRKMDALFDDSASSLVSEAEETQPHWSDSKPSRNVWSIVKLLLTAFIILNALRFVQNHAALPSTASGFRGLVQWPSKIGQLFPSPSFPSLSLPSLSFFRPRAQHPSGVLSEDQYESLRHWFEQRNVRVDQAIDEIQSILPQVVSVKKDWKGRISVGEPFWIALRARILADDKILSLDYKDRISGSHWKAIEQRLQDAGLHVTRKDVEGVMKEKGPAMWEKWLRDNKRKVAEIAAQGQGGKVKVGGGDTIVSKDQFIAELRDQLSSHKNEVDAEIERLRNELKKIVPEVQKIATQGGLTKADASAMIQKMVDYEVTRRIINVGQKSGSKNAVDAMFSQRVNFFSPGNNALIDTSLTSPTYVINLPRLGSKEWLKSSGEQPGYLSDARIALMPWTDAGQCWCAGIMARGNDTYPAALGISLSALIIPQHVVIEHIEPGATNDPQSMPRDIELWGYYPDKARLQRVRNWTYRNMPETAAAVRGPAAIKHTNDLVRQNFARIGRFTYEYKPQDNGVFVYNVSPELTHRGMGATDKIVVRALNNHGAKDHTCFYRVRMYGEVVDV